MVVKLNVGPMDFGDDAVGAKNFENTMRLMGTTVGRIIPVDHPGEFSTESRSVAGVYTGNWISQKVCHHLIS